MTDGWHPTGTTRLAAVIGDPVRHSLSPTLHNAAFRHLDLDWVYVALPVTAGRAGEAVAAMRVMGIDGLSVTMPHKQAVAAAVDVLTPAAAALGAANTVYRDGDRLVGDNTDGSGFVRSMRSQMGFDPHEAAVTVLGAGGAAVAVALALLEGGATVTIVNRSAERARAAVAATGGRAVIGELGAVRSADLIVQATPLGMQADDPLPVDPSLIRAGQLVADLIYHPAETPLLAAARSRGAVAVNGVGMLLFQAGEQFRRWTGCEPPIEVMAAAVGLDL